MYSGNLWYYGLSMNKYSDMIKTILHLAKDEADCDAFSALGLMDNSPGELEPLGFLRGDGNIHYYLVNWSVGSEVINEWDLGTLLI